MLLVVAASALYKSWSYEQELDNLLWKIDAKDIVVSQTPVMSKNKVLSQTVAPKTSIHSLTLYDRCDTTLKYL